MKANPLLLAVILLALLGAGIWYTRENPPPDEDAAPKIVELEEDQIREVTLRQVGEDPITLVRGEDDEWEFGGGLEIPADDTSVGMMVSSLAVLNAERVVSEGVVEWGPYELDEPALSVSYKLEDGSGGVSFGRDTPTGSGVFARLEGDPRLFTVYRYNKTSFEKSVFDLRNKRLLQLDQDTISAVEVRAGGRTLAFEKEDGDWRIAKPQPLRADGFTVNDLVRVVRTAEMTEVLEEGADGPFRRPLATVRVTDAGGEHEMVVVQDGEDHLARSSDQTGTFKVSSTMATGLDKPLEEFRNKKLFDFGFEDPARVEVRAGDLTAEIVRENGRWLLATHERREADSEKVQTLLDRLRNLSATGFPSDRASDKDRYGLAEPGVEAIVTPDSEGSVPETVVVSAPGNAPVYAARNGEPSTYEVEQSAARDIVRALEGLLAEPDEGEESDADAGVDGS